MKIIMLIRKLTRKFDEKMSDIIASIWKITRDEANVKRMYTAARTILSWNMTFVLLTTLLLSVLMMFRKITPNPRWLSVPGLSAEHFTIILTGALVYLFIVLIIRRICFIIMKSARKYNER